MYRFLAAIACLLILCFTLCACGKKDKVMNDASQAVSDVASDVASDVDDMTSADRGTVSDSDGYIDDSESESKSDASENRSFNDMRNSENQTDTFMYRRNTSCVTYIIQAFRDRFLACLLFSFRVVKYTIVIFQVNQLLVSEYVPYFRLIQILAP